MPGPLDVITGMNGGALATLGLVPGIGNDTARQTQDEIEQRRKQQAPGPGAPAAFGDQTIGAAARSLFG